VGKDANAARAARLVFFSDEGPAEANDLVSPNATGREKEIGFLILCGADTSSGKKQYFWDGYVASATVWWGMCCGQRRHSPTGDTGGSGTLPSESMTLSSAKNEPCCTTRRAPEPPRRVASSSQRTTKQSGRRGCVNKPQCRSNHTTLCVCVRRGAVVVGATCSELSGVHC